METSLDHVKKAFEFRGPACVPCYHDGPDSDIASIAFTWRKLDVKPDRYTTEWGFVVRPNPHIAGYHVDFNPIPTWDDYPRYAFPDVAPAQAAIEADYRAKLQENPDYFRDKYILGHMCAGPYLFVGMMRGETNFFMDLVDQKSKVYELFGRVMDYQIALFKKFADLGAHGVLIHEDWGSARGLIMSPHSWREIFLPHYRRAKKAANDLGMHFSIQVTGNVDAIMPDIVREKVVDLLFYPEPCAIGIQRLGKHVKGKLCVFTCTDWKQTGPLGTEEDVRHEMRELVQALSTPKGGLGFWLYTMSEFKETNKKVQFEEYYALREGGKKRRTK
jgi:hypothetical protein